MKKLARLRAQATAWIPFAAGRSVRFGPGVTGIVLMSVGAGMAYLPAGFMVAGALLLVVDRRIP